MSAQLGVDPWVILPRERARYEEQFRALQPVSGIVTGEQAKGFLLKSQLPPQILGQIWALADTDADGKMDINEFSIACKLINLKLRNFELPKTLPPSLLQFGKQSGMAAPLLSGVTQAAPPAIPPLPQQAALGNLRGPQPPSAVVHPLSMTPPPMRPIIPPTGSSMTPLLPMARPSSVPPMGTSPLPPIGSVMGTSPIPPMGSAMDISPIPPMAIVSQGTPPSLINIGGPSLTSSSGLVGANMLTGVAPIIGGPQMTAGPLMGGITSISGVGGAPAAATLPSQPISNGSVIMGQGNVPPPRPPPVSSSVATAPGAPAVDKVASIDSPLSAGSPLHDWAVPHQTKLKYTQLFNTSDRTRTGFLSGPQARNIMVQTQLPQPILAQIWALADMDSDGRLSCDEFVLAMHLCDQAKAGEKIPPTLPPELIPPTFRRTRQGSLTSTQPGLHCEVAEGKDAASLLSTVTFEDKRKENFDKGQVELERRRKALIEIQRKEAEERERKEKEEQEKRERLRLEQERRRQQEHEKQLQKQREQEQEREEQRKRAQEQREAARREMERQRQLEWEKQRCLELQHQRQREQEKVLSLKARNQNLTIELSQLTEKVKELSQKISETRLGVSGVKTTIDGMRSTRDTQMAEMSSLKAKLKEQNQRLVTLGQEKARLDAKNRLNSANDAANQEQVALAFSNKQITLKQMRDRIGDLQEEIEAKNADIENNNTQLGDLKMQLTSLVQECEKLYAVYEQRKKRVLEMKGITNKNKDPTDFTASWGDSGWNETTESAWNTAPESAWPAAEDTVTPASDFVKYRALYEFVARNSDELSFQPGDIILVPVNQNAEPGWLAGELRGHTGWFPESYVEPVDGIVKLERTSIESAVFPDDMDTLQAKRTLEEIAEVPENVSDNGSVAEVIGELGPQVTDLASPILGQGMQVSNVTVEALYPWRARKSTHLSFNKGDTITVKEQQESWWYGELNGAEGWFPKSYVKPTEVVKPEADQEYYVAMYPYQSMESGDLSFQQGDVVLVVKKEGDWWTGTINDRQGIFPSNYVQKAEIEQVPAVVPEPETEQTEFAPAQADTVPPVAVEQPSVSPTPVAALQEVKPVDASTPNTPDFTAMAAQFEDEEGDLKGKGKKPEIATVIAPYQATSSEQLSLQRGQLIMVRKKTATGWWEGELQAKGKKRQIGWFPASYVKLLGGGAKGQTVRESQPSPVPSLQPQVEPQPQVQPQPQTQQNKTEKVVALYPYTAQNEDELTFEKDDVIILLGKDEPSWWRGELKAMTGLFPSNYVMPF